MGRITRALLSCHDKSGLVELAQVLREFDVELISTAGTRKTLDDAGIKSINISDFTGVEEMLDGRVKSLHYRIHAGLLAVRDNKLHVEQLQAHGCPWLDMVVANFQPLETFMETAGDAPDAVIEQIDIGGTALIRSAAKNFRYVTVAVNPERYPSLVHELRAHDGEVSFATRYRLAQEAFARTAAYDERIADYLESTTPKEE